MKTTIHILCLTYIKVLICLALHFWTECICALQKFQPLAWKKDWVKINGKQNNQHNYQYRLYSDITNKRHFINEEQHLDLVFYLNVFFSTQAWSVIKSFLFWETFNQIPICHDIHADAWSNWNLLSFHKLSLQASI